MRDAVPSSFRIAAGLLLAVKHGFASDNTWNARSELRLWNGAEGWYRRSA
jgi:hypothetical protein